MLADCTLGGAHLRKWESWSDEAPVHRLCCSSKQMMVKFDDVAVYFSKEEWRYLNKGQKKLYKYVMMENYQMLCSVGGVNIKPKLISALQRGKELWYFQGDHKGGKQNTYINTCTGSSKIINSRNPNEMCSAEYRVEGSYSHREQVSNKAFKVKKEENHAILQRIIYRRYMNSACVCL
ncbi:zinc finger protein 566-like isoform X2 [Pseudophryne corroboree]|uniref:zinc finger protein 566-like isoform X2 n=1 Tax=Pseudophryne corroboree TaxID=495146 RepID=UPI003081FAE8